MKFDVVVGNPPYQSATGKIGGGADSYTKATKINDEVLILSGQFRQTINAFGNGLFEIVNQ